VYRTHFDSLVKKGSGGIHPVKSSRKIIFVLDKSCGKFFHRIHAQSTVFGENGRPTFLTFSLSLLNRYRLRKNRFLFQQFTGRKSKKNIFVFFFSTWAY
jgi:hypothetical protein